MSWDTMAKDHWNKYLPKMTRELEEQGKLQESLNNAVNQAEEEFGDLVESGMHAHEARGIVLPKYILLPPESPDIV